MQPPLTFNGVPVYPGPKREPWPEPPPKPKGRVFDHMDGEPEDARFCKVAAAMKQSAWWLAWVGKSDEQIKQKPIKGTIKPRLLPKHVEKMSDEEFDRLAQSVHDRSNEETACRTSE